MCIKTAHKEKKVNKFLDTGNFEQIDEAFIYLFLLSLVMSTLSVCLMWLLAASCLS